MPPTDDVDVAQTFDEAVTRTFRVIFQSATCDQCGSTVHVSSACKCGAWQPRADEYVLRRRQAVEPLCQALAEPVEPSEPIELEQAIAVLSPWIADHFKAMDAFGEAEGDPAAVRDTVNTLVNLRGRTAAVPRRRPSLALWDPLRATLEHLVSMVAAQLDGVTAADPQLAQTSEVRAQGHLDDAAAALAVLNDRLNWWGVDKSIRLPDSLVRAASIAYDETGAENALDLDARGQRAYSRVTGRDDAPAGVGIGLLLDLGQAGYAFDEDRLFRVARSVYARLDGSRSRLASMLDNPEWRADLLAARRVFYEAQLTTETVLRHLQGERRVEAESVMRLGTRLVEGVSRSTIGLVVAATRGKGLKRGADYSQIHQAARQDGLADVLTGFDDRIRNAVTHEDFEVGEDYIVLGSRRSPPVRLSDDELVDIVLTGLESSAAIFAGIDCLLAELGHPSATDRFGELPLVDQLKILIATNAIEPTGARLVGDRVEIAGNARPSSSIRPLTVVASIEPYLSADIRELRLRLKRPDGTLVVVAPVAPLRRFRESVGKGKDVALLEFNARTTINGRAVFPRKHTRFVAAFIAHQHLTERVDLARPTLLELVGVARRLNDPQLAESIEAFLAAKAAQEGGGPPLITAQRRAIERLGSYIAVPPGPFKDGSPPAQLAA